MKQKIGILFAFIFLITVNSKAQTISLLTPIDELTDVAPYPTFSWQLIGSSASGLTYTFKIAEYNAAIGDAGSLASPIYSEVINDNSNFITYNYPATLQPLDTCKQYVWQVTATYSTYTTQEPIVPLEVFNFTSDYFHFASTCESDGSSNNTTNQNTLYIVPQKTIDNYVYLVKGNTLNIKYKEPYSYSSIEYRIYNYNNSVNYSNSAYIHYGVNYFSIDLSPLNLSPSPNLYMLELKTSKGDKLKAKFEIKTN